MEAVISIDVLRRGGIDVTVAGVDGVAPIREAHGQIPVEVLDRETEAPANCIMSGERHENGLLWLFIESTRPHVADDTDDGVPLVVVEVEVTETFSEWTLSRPILFCKSAADDGNPPGLLLVRPLESPPGDQRDAHRVEVVWIDES